MALNVSPSRVGDVFLVLCCCFAVPACPLEESKSIEIRMDMETRDGSPIDNQYPLVADGLDMVQVLVSLPEGTPPKDVTLKVSKGYFYHAGGVAVQEDKVTTDPATAKASFLVNVGTDPGDAVLTATVSAKVDGAQMNFSTYSMLFYRRACPDRISLWIDSSLPIPADMISPFVLHATVSRQQGVTSGGVLIVFQVSSDASGLDPGTIVPTGSSYTQTGVSSMVSAYFYPAAVRHAAVVTATAYCIANPNLTWYPDPGIDPDLVPDYVTVNDATLNIYYPGDASAF